MSFYSRNVRRRLVGATCGALLILTVSLPAQKAKRAVPILYIEAETEVGLVLGASQQGRWLSWDKISPQLKGGESFRFYSPAGYAGKRVGKKPALSPASGDAYNVSFVTPVQSKQDLIGLSGAAWNPQPRIPKALAPRSARYRAAVADFLKTQGLPNARVEIGKIQQIDLEGDGVPEVLIEARSVGYDASLQNGGPLQAGDFSLVLLQKTVGGKIKNLLLDGTIHTSSGGVNGDSANRYYLRNVLDLDGDGVMEIVVGWHYSEGGGAEVYRVKGGQVKRVLSAEDGA